MRSSILIVAPFIAAAYGQNDDVNATEIIVSSGTTSVSSTYTFSNFETNFLTETDSRGVVTGQPDVATAQSALPSLPAGVTTQPEVATIPAALPNGINTIALGANSSFLVSVGSSTTSVIGGDGVSTDASVVEGATAGIASASTITTSGSGSAGMTSSTESPSPSSTDSSDNDSDSDSSSSSSASSTSDDDNASSSSASSSASPSNSDSAASSNVQIASAGLLGLGALFVALL